MHGKALFMPVVGLQQCLLIQLNQMEGLQACSAAFKHPCGHFLLLLLLLLLLSAH
jgi:hypothetical protein